MDKPELTEVDTYQLLGFSARVVLPWKRREEPRMHGFLLRTDVTKPLSTDTTVWNSVFDLAERTSTAMLQKPVGADPEDETTRHYSDIWMSPCELEVNVKSLTAPVPCDIVAITRFVHPSSIDAFWPKPDHPQAVNPSWEFIGFDVSDELLLSGLTNCGYRDSERALLTERFASMLNNYHLFDQMDDACQFQEISDDRAAEHSPFYVYGLWRVQSLFATE